MIRTQVYLPEDLHQELKFLAKAEKTNFSNLIRQGAEEVIRKKIKKKEKFDPWKSFVGKGKKGGDKDLSSNIDYYLYIEPYQRLNKK